MLLTSHVVQESLLPSLYSVFIILSRIIVENKRWNWKVGFFSCVFRCKLAIWQSKMELDSLIFNQFWKTFGVTVYSGPCLARPVGP